MFIAVAMPTEIIILIAIKVLGATKLEAFKRVSIVQYSPNARGSKYPSRAEEEIIGHRFE
jgi:hypothetical protein